MRLAEAGAAVDEERVVRLRRRFGDCERGGMCESVRGADHEGVEGVLRVEAAALGAARNPLDHDGSGRHSLVAVVLQPGYGGSGAGGDAQLDRPVRSGHVADRGADQAAKMAFDPVAGEVVGHTEDEAGVGELEPCDLAEPGAVRRVVEGTPEAAGDLTPEALGCQLDLVLHPAVSPSLVYPVASIAASR
jgi:hypothetical protein